MIRNTLMAAAIATALLLPAGTAQAASSETYRQLNLFGDVFERVRSEYVEEVGDEKLIEAAIKGMLSSLDPHSSYLSAKAYDDMKVQTRGEFGGLGIEVTMENGLVKVVSPIDDTPAHRAGLEPNDYISHIDGEPVMGLTLNEAVEQMRGPVNSRIVITVLRQGEEPFDVTIVRDVIRIRSVRARAEDDIAYIRITSFNEQTYAGLVDSLEDLRTEIGEDLKGVVVDLRNNPGGLLDQAVQVSDAFLNEGEIVSTRGRREENVQLFNARPGDIAEGLPVAILINGGSASASEIVAGALKDHNRAVIVGTQSFGKGSVQTIVPLPGNGAMRLTTARYYTPNGESIQAKGIEPDVIVEQATIQVQNGAGRREQDLRNHLEDGETEAEESGTIDPIPEIIEGDPAEEAAAAPEPGVQDYQLQRALDLIRGKALFDQKA